MSAHAVAPMYCIHKEGSSLGTETGLQEAAKKCKNFRNRGILAHLLFASYEHGDDFSVIHLTAQ